MSAADVAEARQAALVSTTDRAESQASRAWLGMDFADLDGSWESIGPAITLAAMRAQDAVARGGNGYVSELVKLDGFDADAGRVNPGAFVGVDGDGRSVETLLHGAVTTTKEAIGTGLGRVRSFEAGAAYLTAMLSTVIADTGRTVDQTAGISRGYTTYARVVEPGACSRCVVLAGATQFGPFKRHPKCRCTVQPIDVVPGDPAYGPSSVFHGMPTGEQDRVFGKAGAEAIRQGADINQVVSARRGISTAMKAGKPVRLQGTVVGRNPDGSAIRVLTTNEGTTRRGLYGQAQRRLGAADVRLNGSRYSSTTRKRLMPEAIMSLTTDPAERRILLQDAGFILPTGRTGAELAASEFEAHTAANAIYSRLGIQR